LEAALKHASIMESFTSTRGKGTEAEQSNASEKSKKQPVDKYEGRVRSVVRDDEIPVTEAFIRQVVERIQGVIEAKLIPAQFPSVTIIQSAYPGLSYQALSYCPVPYTNASLPQVAYANTSESQPSTAIPRNVSELATTSTQPTVTNYDSNRKC